MCLRREDNFRTKMEDKVKELCRYHLKNEYTDKEIKKIFKQLSYNIGAITSSLATDYFRGTEDPPPQATILTKLPAINVHPDEHPLPDDYAVLKTVMEEKKLIDEGKLTQEERTIKPTNIPAAALIYDRMGYLGIEVERNKLQIKNPLKCNKNIVRMFKFLESQMDFEYGSDMENFGFKELALTPNQAYVVKHGRDFEGVEMDCEDMHTFGATLFKTAGMIDRYRLLKLEKHLGLCVLDDSFERFVIIELTQEKPDLGRFSSVKDLPTYGGDHNLPTRPEDVVLTYDHSGYYGSLKLFNDRTPKAEDWMENTIKPELIIFKDGKFQRVSL
ncbi:MAG: hypothetical protein GTN76_11350 [Candidatus Aenigmarchaeota archaeon]|nr:hypothetical protein [Candidatus Aenigmarchaeota archaeon]NIQ18024.1 hypothetical protein [Candidatus Aenigmarchaeota archaeon]